MLQEGDLLIVYIAYQQTYPQQLWTIKDGRFVHNFCAKDIFSSRIAGSSNVPARRFMQKGEGKAKTRALLGTAPRASSDLVSQDRIPTSDAGVEAGGFESGINKQKTR
jgi:hypothetical protein